jgi:hypothetical protein
MTKRSRKRSEGKPRPAPAAGFDMDANPSAVLAAYGHTMLVWQILEQHLGQLWVMGLVGEHQLATDRTVKKGIRRSIHAATKATATESLRGLEGHLDQNLYREIEAAIQWRDVLAHRYLRERMRGSLQSGHFMAGTSDELGELYDRFVWLASELEALIVAEEEAMADEIAELDDALVETLERVGRALLRNEPLPGADKQ